jgi:hypothetical protein
MIGGMLSNQVTQLRQLLRSAPGRPARRRACAKSPAISRPEG